MDILEFTVRDKVLIALFDALTTSVEVFIGVLVPYTQFAMHFFFCGMGTVLLGSKKKVLAQVLVKTKKIKPIRTIFLSNLVELENIYFIGIIYFYYTQFLFRFRKDTCISNILWFFNNHRRRYSNYFDMISILAV